MIHLLTFMIIYSIATSYQHKWMIAREVKLWHTMSAAIDGFVIMFMVLFLRYNWFYLYYWTDFIAIACTYMLIRDVTRTLILGIGDTSWIDRNIKGFWRLSIWAFLLFITVIYQVEYWRYAGTHKTLDTWTAFIELF